MHQFDLKNKTAIITGGAQGFGLNIAEKFLNSGAKVAIWDIDKELLEKVKKDLNNKNLFCDPYGLDVTSTGAISGGIDRIIKGFSDKIDILVNNAGITGSTKKLWDYTDEEWKKVIDVNLNGTFYCCKAVVPYMIKNNYGRIVNISSVAGKDGNVNASAYSAAKAAVLGLTKALGKELANKNIAVNAVTPAGAKTRILDQMSKDHVQNMLSKVPRGRFLELSELSSLVCWLSSEENSFSTGAVFDISGGRSTY